MSAAPRWTRLEHDERREQILAAARRLFSERPFAEVSTTEVAREAGVARGLLHHYFGGKRELYLAVLRSMLRYPALPEPEAGGDPGAGIDRWLTMIERNREAWLAAIGAQGLGRDPEVEAILEEARETAVTRLARAVAPEDPDRAELRAVLRSYSGLAEAASLEWIVRGRLTRPQVHALLLHTLTTLVRDVLPEVERARPEGG
jgi:AcrR family transcriptional regulator